MKLILSARSLVAVAFVAATLGACAKQDQANRPVDNTAARKDQILANLAIRHPRLAELQPTLGDITAISPGMDSVQMTFKTPRGTSSQTLIMTTDNKALYITMDGPIDVSKNATELTADQKKKDTERAAELAAAVSKLPMRGNPQAPVTIVEFSDFQCPYCRKGFELMEEVVKKYPDKVRFVFMHYPLPFHPWAKVASQASICAGTQKPEAFWTLHDAYFANQEKLTLENVVKESEGYLKAAGLDLAKWNTCTAKAESPEYQAAAKALQEAMDLGQKHGVEGTPAFFVNGKFLNGAVPMPEFDQAIAQALGQKS